MIKTILCVAITATAGMVSAFAIPTSLSVDFRSQAWQSANGLTSATINGITATAEFPPGSTLGWSSSGGLGVGGPLGNPTTVGSFEIMDTAFSLSSGQNLSGVWLTNLFGGLIPETGYLTLNTTQGLLTFLFSGTQTSWQNPLGDYYVNFGRAYNVLDTMFFGVVGNYSVAGFTKSVPDGGATVALLGIALVALAAFRWKTSTEAQRRPVLIEKPQ